RDDVPCEKQQPNDSPPGPQPFLLGIRYGEKRVEPVPVLYDEGRCGCREEDNRIREAPCFRYRVFKADDPATKGCWGEDEGPSPPCPKYPPEMHAPAPPGKQAAAVTGCLTPDCHCGPMVPLILVKPKVEGRGWQDFDLDPHGRRY